MFSSVEWSVVTFINEKHAIVEDTLLSGLHRYKVMISVALLFVLVPVISPSDLTTFNF